MKKQIKDQTKKPRPVPEKAPLGLLKDDPWLTPYTEKLEARVAATRAKETEILKAQKPKTLANFANGHLFYGLHRTSTGWVFREWAPNATQLFLCGDFSSWQDQSAFALEKIDAVGNWAISLDAAQLKHLDYYKLSMHWKDGCGYRIPAYAGYVVQDPDTNLFCARVWDPFDPYQFKHASPPATNPPLIYEAHIGMAQNHESVGTFSEFQTNILPRIAKSGYNTLQLMAIQEHPYYGSFGYQVSSFFAPSSRFGTPDQLKMLIDEAHRLGLRVIMDLVHSHAVKNKEDGISHFDGTCYQYFHEGEKGYHSGWDTRCFNYGKPQVLHFLLSNCKYWMERFHIDGFRLDGVTSMLYFHRGLNTVFSHYDDYFSDSTDLDATSYLSLVNKLVHQINPQAITIAEDASGMPGLVYPWEKGGLGFNYRLGMGLPDFWIKLLKEQKDEAWNMDEIWHQLTNYRQEEKVIAYSESHDQALVGDKTLSFRLMDQDMYHHMHKDQRNLLIDRGLALHKLIRLITLGTAKGGYLNFMGNEFGHPEWIDFPRAGNGWSYHYAKRQWHLADDPNLCYSYLLKFDQAMLTLISTHSTLAAKHLILRHIHCQDRIICFSRGCLTFVFNFHPDASHKDYQIQIDAGSYQVVLNSDAHQFGGFDISTTNTYIAHQASTENTATVLSLYLPARSVIVLEKS